MTTYNLFPAGTTLPGSPDSDTTSITLATEFYVTVAGCTVTHLRWWVPGSSTSLTGRQGALFTVDSDGSNVTQVLSTVNFPDGVAGTWCEVALGTPFALTQNQRYRVAVHHPGGVYPATGGYFTGGEGGDPLVQGPVTRPSWWTAAGERQGSYAVSATLAAPTNGFNGGCYFSDVTIYDGVTAIPSGIATGEAFGTAAASTLLTVVPAGVTSSESFGNPAVTTLLTAAPGGIAGGEAMGSPSVSTTMTASPAGIASAETFGTAIMSGMLTVSPTGVGTAEAFGTAKAAGPPVTATAVGIDTLEAVGTPTAVPRVTLRPTAIATAEALGIPTATLKPAATTATAIAIASLEAFGSPAASGSLGAPADLSRRYSGTIPNNRWDGSFG